MPNLAPIFYLDIRTQYSFLNGIYKESREQFHIKNLRLFYLSAQVF